MATQTTTTRNLRYHMALGNGGSRYVDIENPIDDGEQIYANIESLNNKLNPAGEGQDAGIYAGILASEQYFNGDTDATVTQITLAEIIQVTKTTTTEQIY